MFTIVSLLYMYMPSHKNLPSNSGPFALPLAPSIENSVSSVLKLLLGFYSASALLAMQSAVLARGILSVCLSACLSVRPSRSGIVSRRMKIGSCGFQHLVGQSLHRRY